MARRCRVYSNSKTYHNILKGIDNQNIFYEDQDRNVFLKYMLITKKEYNYNIYSYCLMDNHVHLVIKSEKEFLSKIFQSLMVRYVQYFNKKYKRSGTLLQGRFKSMNVENLNYFLKVCKYVHQNPENAGIAKVKDYKWSSYNEYVGKGKLVDKSILLHYYDNDIDKFIKDTIKFDGKEYLSELAEFELIRKLTDEQVSNIIKVLFDIKDTNEISAYFKNLEKDDMIKCIRKMREITGTNKTQIARVARINRHIVERVWDEKM